MWQEVEESGRTPGIPGVRHINRVVAQMFIGQFQHAIDEKGRLMIPARFRELLEGGGAYITQGFDRCLMVMAEAYFNQVYERINSMNLANPDARLLRRQMLSNAYPVDLDKIGRMLVPQNLRTFIGLDSEAIVAGQGGYFEIWTPATWNEQMTQMQNTAAANQRFATLDLSKPIGPQA